MVVLTGKSNSGKDAIGKQLELINYHHLSTYATRKIREGEIQDYTYHFISTADFLTKLQNDYFLEWRWYDKSDESIVFYGSGLQDIIDADDKSYIILTPSGIKKLKDKNIPVTVFYIDVSDDVIRLRQELRGDATHEEMERRFQADKHDFVDIESLYDFKINNEKKTPMDSALEIDRLYRNGREQL